MKRKLITEILSRLHSTLSTTQIGELTVILEASLVNFEIIERKSNTPGNDELLQMFLNAKNIEGCSQKSLDYYKATLKRMITEVNKSIILISTDDLRAYLSNYQNERKSSKVTINNMRRIFSSFFGWLEDEDYILKSPVRRIGNIKVDKIIKETLSDENLESIRDCCVELRDLAMVDLLASTGMRVGELVGLKIEDIDFNERECLVFGKGNSERIVYFDARTKMHLSEYIKSRNDDNPYLFVSLNNSRKRLEIGGVETRLRVIGKKANLDKVHPHKFRRTLATRAIDKGMPIEQVQHMLGHVKIDTTMHYAMVNQCNVKNSHRKYIS